MDNNTYQLSKLLEGLDMVSTDCSVYMHKKTLEFDVITDENLRIYELFQSDEDRSLLDWEKDMIQTIDDILNVHVHDYLKLPDAYEIHDHNIMENFAYTLSDHLKNEFLSTVFRKGAFRRFEQLLLHYGLRQQWFDYKRKVYLDKLANWCETQGLNYE